jgi:hypothetical protein
MTDLRAVLLACLLAGPAVAADPAPLFSDHTVLDVRIEAPIKVLMEVRPDESYLKGTFVFTDLDGVERDMPLKLRTRGNYRRDESHCDFAPIRLNFPKNDVYGTLLEGQDKLKLVTHCRSDAPQHERYLLREYLAYRLFAELSEISYRVRLLRITYHDPYEDESLTRYGFVIEDDKAVAKRNELKTIKFRRVTHDDYDPLYQNLVHVFQFMIGNTEYSLTSPEPSKNCCHNVDLMAAIKAPPFIPVPFDFDFSGLVDAAYAEPNPRYPIRTVRTRFYKGRCKNNAQIPETLAEFQRKRDDLFAVIASVADLDDQAARSARAARDYIERFYKLIGDPDEVRKQLVEHCDEPS